MVEGYIAFWVDHPGLICKKDVHKLGLGDWTNNDCGMDKG